MLGSLATKSLLSWLINARLGRNLHGSIFLSFTSWSSTNVYWHSQIYTKTVAFRHLTHWGRVTHIWVSKLTITGSDNGLSPGRRQAVIWTNAGIMLIGPLGTNFSEILIEIYIFSFKKMHLKMSSGKWRPSCLGLNVITIITVPK